MGENNSFEQRDALRSKFDETVLSTDESGRYIHNFSLKEEGFTADGLCRESWSNAYSVKPCMLEALAREKKQGK